MDKFHESSPNQDEYARYWSVHEEQPEYFTKTVYTLPDSFFENEDPDVASIEEDDPPDTVVSTGNANDHTCGCGNTRCNKTEKSCWKCGAPIVP